MIQKEPKAIKFSFDKTKLVLESWSEWDHLRIEPESGRHQWIAYDEERNKLWAFRLPLPLPAIGENTSLDTYLDQLPEEIPSYCIMLIQAGAAALGYFEEGEVLLHKAFKKYMKRHKRGKSQISYLNTRGKSKAGSRIRLANTVRFFEEINERVGEWDELYEPERILYSTTAQLWGLLFQSNVKPPFEKKDIRLAKIPVDVNIPTFEELMRVNRIITSGWLYLYEESTDWQELIEDAE